MAPITALRGLLAGLAVTGFILTILLAQVRSVSLGILGGLVGASVLLLVAAGGCSAVRRLFAREARDPSANGADWWPARLEPALEDVWNRWSDLVLTIGLAVMGLGAFGLAITAPADHPPIGLLFIGFIGLNGAIITLSVSMYQPAS